MATPEKTRLADETARLEALLADDPASAEFYRLANAYVRAGRFADAIAVCQKGLKQHPRGVEGYVALGRALFASNKLAAADEVLRRAISLDVTRPESHRLLGEILLRRDMPQDAVVTLQRARKVGAADAKVDAVLERARIALDREQTQVGPRSPAAAPRGMGNRAVAGSIGATGEIVPSTLEAEVTRRVVRTPPAGAPAFVAADQVTSEFVGGAQEVEQGPPEALPVPGIETTGETDMESIGDRWEQELQADAEDPWAPSDSDIRDSTGRPALGPLDLPPLSDPLAEGMPPLPPETSEIDLVALGVAGPHAGRPASDPAAGRALDGAPGDETDSGIASPTLIDTPPEIADDGPPAERRVGLRTLPDVRERVAREQLSDGSATLVDLQAPGEVDPATAPTERAAPLDVVDAALKRQRDRQGGRQDDDAVAVETEPAEAAADAAPAVPERDMSTDSILLEGLVGAAETGVVPAPAELHDLDEVLGSPRRRPLAPWIILALVAIGAGGFLGWRYFEGRALLAQGQAAIEAGDAVALERSAARLARARAVPKQVAAQARLVAAIAWLVHRTGRAPGTSEQGADRPWRARAADAALQLAQGNADRARALLDRAPEDAASRRVQRLLLTWAAWLQGAPLTSAGRDDGMALVSLVQGHRQRERGAPDLAEQAYRAALRQNSGLELAAMGLAATLLTSGAKSSEVERALGASPRSALARAWHKLLGVERKLRQGQRATLDSAALPDDPALLFHAVRVHLLACDHEGADAAWERLKQRRAPDDGSMRALAAEVALARGHDQHALALSGEVASPWPALTRLRAWASLMLERPAEAAKLLAGDDSEQARPLRLLAAALGKEGGELEQLAALAAKSPLGKVAYARALLAHHKAAEAERVALGAGAAGELLARALTVAARAQLVQGRLRQGFGTLEQVRNRCPGFLPAEELRGVAMVRLGRTSDGVAVLAAVKDQGRSTRTLLSALTVGYADLGQRNQALVTLRELGGAPGVSAALAAGYVRLAEGEHQAAIKALGRAGQSLMAQLGLGRAYLAAGRDNEAEAVLERLSERFPEHPLPALYLGELNRVAQDPEALRFYRQAIELTKRNPQMPRVGLARAELGIARYLFELKDRPDDALPHVEAAIEALPSNARAHRLLGEVEFARDHAAAARKALSRSVELDAEDATGWYLLARAYGGDKKGAHRAYARFLELEPKGSRADKARRALTKLR